MYDKVEAMARERVHISRQFLFHSTLTPFCGASIHIEMADKQINKQQQQQQIGANRCIVCTVYARVYRTMGGICGELRDIVAWYVYNISAYTMWHHSTIKYDPKKQLPLSLLRGMPLNGWHGRAKCGNQALNK